METFFSGLFFMLFLFSLCHALSVSIVKKLNKRKRRAAQSPPLQQERVYYVTREQAPQQSKTPDIPLKSIIIKDGSVVVEEGALPPKLPQGTAKKKKSQPKKR